MQSWVTMTSVLQFKTTSVKLQVTWIIW